MKVTFKLLDQRTFELEVGAEEGVDDLICRMEDRLGGENLYRLIYAGKMMREGEMLSEYAMTGRLPVVVMMTKLEAYRRDEREAEDGPKVKRVRTDSKDSGFGEEEGKHFVTDREFSIALEWVMSCQYFRRLPETLSMGQKVAMVEEMFPEEEEVREVILGRMEEVEEAGPTREQFRAFILDIQGMYQEAREGLALEGKKEEQDNEEEEVEDMLPLVERNIGSLLGMGFTRENVTEALSRSSGSLQVALDLLLPQDTTPPALPSPGPSKPLAFLREVPEFHFLRVLVIQQPSLLQPLLIRYTTNMI